MKKLFKPALTVLIFLALLSPLARAVLAPKEINSYESRLAYQLPGFSADAFAAGSFQADFENALSDQLPFSQHLKKLYNNISSTYLEYGIDSISQTSPDTVIKYNGIRIYRGYMLYDLYNFEDTKLAYDSFSESYNKAIAANPECSFAFYYIESDTCFDPVTGEKNASYTYLADSLNETDGMMDRLVIDSFQDYSRYYRKTDHHWNQQGCYEAYLDIIKMLGVEDEALSPAETAYIGSVFPGSKASGAGLHSVMEESLVYYFDYPDSFYEYGEEELFRSGQLSNFSYGSFYGGDDGERIFDTGRDDRDNLVVIGDSFDNPVLKLIASHFGKTYCLDLRYYTSPDGMLNISEYIRKHDIDTVLVIGSDFLYGSYDFEVVS